MTKKIDTPPSQTCNRALGLAVESDRAEIRARDIMTTDIVLIGPEKSIREAAAFFAEKGVSAVPVVQNGVILGILSEADLIRRQELGTEESLSKHNLPGMNVDVAKSHGAHVRDVMSPNVTSVSEDTSLGDIVQTLLNKNIKQVPVMRNEKLVGVVSRGDIVRALAARPDPPHPPLDSDDDIIRFRVIETLVNIAGTSPWLTDIEVCRGVVELRGRIEDETKREFSRLAVANIRHVVEVRDHRTELQPYWG